MCVCVGGCGNECVSTSVCLIVQLCCVCMCVCMGVGVPTSLRNVCTEVQLLILSNIASYVCVHVCVVRFALDMVGGDTFLVPEIK